MQICFNSSIGWEAVEGFEWIVSVSIDFGHYLSTETSLVLVIVQVLYVPIMFGLDLIF